MISKRGRNRLLTCLLAGMTCTAISQEVTEPPVTFTYELSKGNHVYPGKDLQDRAHLLMNAFKPGLDEPLDEAGVVLFNQLHGLPHNDRPNYLPVEKTWGINPSRTITDLKRTHNLAYLNIAIHRADNLICLLNDPQTGRVVASTGKREAVWQPGDKNDPIEGPITRVAHLATGNSGVSVMSVVNYILSHPQLHNLPAPAPMHPELLPSHIQDLGRTYLDRALVYLESMNEICEFFIREGSYWEYDTSDPENILGWWFSNAVGQYRKRELIKPDSDIEKMAEARAKFPDGIQFSATAFAGLGVGARPNNRALILNSMFATTAHALHLLDRLQGTSENQGTIEAYNRIVRHCNNSFRAFSFDVDEGPFLGTSRIFQYTSAKFVEFLDHKEAWYVEDAGHLLMDMGAINRLQQITDLHPGDPLFKYITEQDLRALTGTAFSRFFDLQANIVCGAIYVQPHDERGDRTRNLGLDKDGIPHPHPDYMINKGCPSASTFIGRYGTILQQLAINAKLLEMGNERLRNMGIDKGLAGYILQRTDSWPNYRFAYPFELNSLRSARAKSRPDPVTPNHHAPTCRAPDALTISPSMVRGQKLLTLKGADNDADQTVTYFIIDGNHGLHLYLDPMTGDLSLNKYYPLVDGETDAYDLKVMVSDNGNPSRYQIITIPVTRTSN